MKALSLTLLLVCLVGCSGENKSSSGPQTVGDPMPAGAKQEELSKKDDIPTVDSNAKKKFEDDVFKVPVYPGSKEVQSTRMIMDTDVSKSYNCTFTTSDDPDKIADFYKAEGAKVGKIIDMPLGQKPGTGLRVVAVQVNEKEKIQIQATKPNKGDTMFTVHYVIQKP